MAIHKLARPLVYTGLPGFIKGQAKDAPEGAP